MSEPWPGAAARCEAQQTASADATAVRRQAVAVSPALGPLPAIYVPLGPRRPSEVSRPLHAGFGLARLAGGVVVVRYLGRRQGRSGGPRHPGPSPPACGGPAARPREGREETSRQQRPLATAPSSWPEPSEVDNICHAVTKEAETHPRTDSPLRVSEYPSEAGTGRKTGYRLREGKRGIRPDRPTEEARAVTVAAEVADAVLRGDALRPAPDHETWRFGPSHAKPSFMFLAERNP